MILYLENPPGVVVFWQDPGGVCPLQRAMDLVQIAVGLPTDVLVWAAGGEERVKR